MAGERAGSPFPIPLSLSGHVCCNIRQPTRSPTPPSILRWNGKHTTPIPPGAWSLLPLVPGTVYAVCFHPYITRDNTPPRTNFNSDYLDNEDSATLSDTFRAIFISCAPLILARIFTCYLPMYCMTLFLVSQSTNVTVSYPDPRIANYRTVFRSANYRIIVPYPGPICWSAKHCI